MKIRNLAIIALLATLCVATAAAQNSAVTTDDQNTTPSRRRTRVEVRTGHELRIGVGAFSRPGYKEFGGGGCMDMVATSSDLSSAKVYFGNTYYTGAYSVGYVYRFTRLVSFGLTATYAENHSYAYDTFSGERLGSLFDHYISFVPMVRLHWLNRRWVSLYSAVGIGITIDYNRYSVHEVETNNDVNITGQITPLGITVGRRLFGFAEVGYGAQGIIVGGIGYKF